MYIGVPFRNLPPRRALANSAMGDYVGNSALGKGGASGWAHYPKTNCWWAGHGSVEIDSPKGTAVPGIHGLEECKASCVNFGYRCQGIIFSPIEGFCFRKGEIDLAKCDRQHKKLDLYLRTDAFPPAPPPPPWSIENAKYMSSGVWRKWVRDQESKFFWMWSAYGWSRRHPEDPACWGHRGETADRFFNDARSGEQCQQNWNYQWGHGLDHAPAVFGFAETMQDYCNAHNTRPGFHRWDLAGSCQEANITILRIGDWNMCKNFQWSFCAMQGLLPGQGGNTKIYFSKTPKTLDISDFLEGRHHRCCGEFAENDIYYLEVCTLDEICRNSNELWTLEVGDPFVCEIDDVKYHQLTDALTRWD